MTETPLDKVLGRFVRIVDPAGRQNAWTTSRIGVLPDGTFVPVLTALAEEKFGEDYDPELHLVFWKDKNWRNETWDNVAMAERAIGKGKVRKNPYGYPAGTKEYWNAYRAANKEKMRAYRVRANAKHKELLRAVVDRDQALVDALLAER